MDILNLSEFEQTHLLWDKLVFLYAIFSIIIGSCIMRMVDFVSNTYSVMVKKKRLYYWAHLFGLFMLFFMLLFYWFNVFDWPEEWKEKTSQSFIVYISSLIYPILLYASIIVLTPKVTYRLKIQEHFHKHRKTLFAMFALASFYLAFHDLFFLNQEFKMQKHFIRILGGVSTLIISLLNEKNFKKHFTWLYILSTAIFVLYFLTSKMGQQEVSHEFINTHKLIINENNIQYGDSIFDKKIDDRVYIKDQDGMCVAVAEQKKGVWKINTEEKILEHVNRNFHNAKPNGNLQLIGFRKKQNNLFDYFKIEAYYEDERGCIWQLYKKVASKYHNPKFYYKLVHADEYGKEHEIVVSKMDCQDITPKTIIVNDSIIIRNNSFEGTYNNGLSILTHYKKDVKYHTWKKYQHYINFGTYEPAKFNENDKKLREQIVKIR